MSNQNPFGNGADMDIKVADGTFDSIKETAVKMLEAGEKTTPLRAPSGEAMMTITSDKNLLRFAVMQIEVNGVMIYAGFLK